MSDEKLRGAHFAVREECQTQTEQNDSTVSASKSESVESLPFSDSISPADFPSEASDSSPDCVDCNSEQRKSHTFMRALLILMLVIGAVAASAAIYINHSIAEGKKSFEASMQKVVEESGSIIHRNGKAYKLNEHMVTVAFIGFDGNTRNSLTGDSTTGQSDTIMVFALDTISGKATCISIPRDSWVDVDTYIDGTYSGQQKMQICLQYTYGKDPGDSSQLVAQCASRILSGIPIDYYFTLDIKGVGPLADSLGGISLTPVQTLFKFDIYEGKPTVLSGERAARYVQYRDTDIDTSSLDRQNRQISFVKAFAQQAIASAGGDPAKLVSLYQTALEYTWTNLGLDEFSYIASILASHGISTLETVALQGELTSEGRHAAFMLDQEQVQQTVLDVFYTPVD